MITGDIALVNGRAVTAESQFDATIVLTGGRISHIVPPGGDSLEVGHIVDATGKLIMPGGVDPHCHIKCAFRQSPHERRSRERLDCRALRWHHHRG